MSLLMYIVDVDLLLQFFCELHTQILANTNPDYLLGENGDDSSAIEKNLTVMKLISFELINKTLTTKLHILHYFMQWIRCRCLASRA